MKAISLRKLVSGIGLFVAAMTAVTLPIGYFAVGHISLAGLLVVSCLFGLGMFLAVRTLSLRVLDQTLGALANTNSQFDAALNNMSQGLLLFDANQRVVVVNRKYIEMYGLSPEVVKPGCHLADLMRHRKDRGSFFGDVDQYCTEIAAALAQGKPASFVAEIPGGRSIHIVNHPLADGRWVATHEEITERQNLLRAHTEAERLLREQKMQLDTALNNMVHGLCMLDAQGRVVLFNERYREMMGLPAESLLGRSLLDLIRYRKKAGDFGGDPDQSFASFLAAARAGETITRGLTSKGRALRVVNHPMANGGWVATFEDITEQRQAEQERDRNREFLDQIVENIPMTILVKDAATRRFVLANRAAEVHWSFDRHDAIGKTPHDLFPKAQADSMTELDNKVLQADGPIYFGAHRNLVGPDTGRIVASKRLCIRGEGGQPKYIITVIEDVTERHEIEQERDRNREFLDQIIENIPVTIVVKDAVTRKFVLANRAAEILWSFDRRQAIGKTPHELFPKAQADVMTEHDDIGVRADGPVFFPAHRNLGGPDGGRILTSRRLTIRGPDQQPKYLVTVIEDVTERHELEKERDRNREFLDQIIENVPSIIFVKNAGDRRYVLVNRAAESFWGISRANILGKTAHDVFSKAEADRITAREDELLEGNEPVFDEREIDAASGGLRSVFSRRLTIQGGEQKAQYILAVVEDVTERKNAEQRIAHLAHFDALTTLPNRVLLREKLEQELSLVRRGGRLAVLYLDLDHFKRVNDTLGHSAGDELLKAVTERMRNCLREVDIFARLGGDEFAIVQTGLERPTDAAVLAQRLRDAVTRTHYELHGHQVVVDISIGIALAPDDGTEVDELLKCADMALYGAKAEGRGTFRFFESEMDARMKMRRSLEVDLRKAVLNKEFELHYQPVVRLADNQVTGCEALLRWHHPERGLISPADFIPVAEETGLINAIGEWVLRQACSEAATWPNDIKVAVNVSPVQFRSQGLPQTVISALAAAGLSPRRLELEITESVLMQSNETTLQRLHQLRELGVRISMDDFGTGYSSLSYLRSFPFDKIKIDRSFINDLANGKDAVAIVQAIVTLANSLNMTTTAEGVETERQAKTLRTMGCIEMQGYLFSPPKTSHDITRLLAARRKRIASAA